MNKIILFHLICIILYMAAVGDIIQEFSSYHHVYNGFIKGTVPKINMAEKCWHASWCVSECMSLTCYLSTAASRYTRIEPQRSELPKGVLNELNFDAKSKVSSPLPPPERGLGLLRSKTGINSITRAFVFFFTTSFGSTV